MTALTLHLGHHTTNCTSCNHHPSNVHWKIRRTPDLHVTPPLVLNAPQSSQFQGNSPSQDSLTSDPEAESALPVLPASGAAEPVVHWNYPFCCQDQWLRSRTTLSVHTVLLWTSWKPDIHKYEAGFALILSNVFFWWVTGRSSGCSTETISTRWHP